MAAFLDYNLALMRMAGLWAETPAGNRATAGSSRTSSLSLSLSLWTTDVIYIIINSSDVGSLKGSEDSANVIYICACEMKRTREDSASTYSLTCTYFY